MSSASDGTSGFKADLRGQVAVVTGGGRGIGRAIALALAAARARVAVLARSADELAETVRLIERSKGQAAAFPTNVAESESVTRTFAEVERALGPVDLLVNNASVPGPLGPFSGTDPAEWWKAMEIIFAAPCYARGRSCQA